MKTPGISVPFPLPITPQGQFLGVCPCVSSPLMIGDYRGGLYICLYFLEVVLKSKNRLLKLFKMK